MSEKSPINVRINKQLREDGKNLFKGMGINPTMAVNLFLEECLIKNGLPFAINYSPMQEYAENNATLQLEVNIELKTEAMRILKIQGLTLSEGINLFYRQTVTIGELPF